MDQIEVINVFKGYSDKKTGRVIKSPAFLFSVVYSWTGLNYVCKAKQKKTLRNV